MTTVIYNARAVDGDGVTNDAWVAWNDTHIVARGIGNEWISASTSDATVVDAEGAWLAPGFIDIHVHGGGGHAFDDGADAIRQGLAVHRSRGTTRSVVSLVTQSVPALTSQLSTIAELTESDPLILGSHLEGPFLDLGQRGAHNANHIRTPDSETVDALLDAGKGTIRQITIAPELPGAYEAIDRFVEQNIVVALGHTNADYDMARRTFDRGASMLTHAYNGMNGIQHRRPGPLVAAFADNRVTLEIILDGLHVHPDVARVAFMCAPGRVALVTDGMAAAGSVDGNYRFGSLNVTVTGGMAVLSGTTTIAGSTLTLDRAVRLAIETAGQTPENAIAMATAIPARALGIDDRLGYLRAGYAADVVLLDQAWNVRNVWANGAPIA